MNRRDCFGLVVLPVALMPQSVLGQAIIEQTTQRDLEALKLKSDGITLDFPRLADTWATSRGATARHSGSTSTSAIRTA